MNDEHKVRKPMYQYYYTDDDYHEVLSKLPDLIDQLTIKVGDILEPTVSEKRRVREVIKKFIRDRGRIIYGGTAINELIIKKDPNDAIYNDYTQTDIEFYSPAPVVDAVELTNILYDAGFKSPTATEANHEGTYSIFVNYQLYCDISYVPKRIYNGIKKEVIDGINYADAHFILIDQLRIMNQPLTVGHQRWEKTFKRMYLLLHHYPIEKYNKKAVFDQPSPDIMAYQKQIMKAYLRVPDNQNTCLITGFEAYNYYIKSAIMDENLSKMARVKRDTNELFVNLSSFVINVPYLELISVDYRYTVESIYTFLKDIVADSSKLSIDEYWPLFQFVGYSLTIKYDDKPLVNIISADGFCVPDIRTVKGYRYVSYQYLLMMMYINKFRAYLDKTNQSMYFNYGILISNLVYARNLFLDARGLGVINNTVFTDFRITCIGATVNTLREVSLRRQERYDKGKPLFRYKPDVFFAQSKESQERFDPKKHNFSNTSGNKIIHADKLLFHIDEYGNIKENVVSDNDTDNESDTQEGGTHIPEHNDLTNIDY